MKYCFLDLETTGFEADKDSIIEASFIIHDEDQTEIDRFDQVLIPQRSPLNDQVTQITGITQTEIDESGVAFDTVKDRIQEALDGCVIVGHNIDFDIGFLLSHGIELDSDMRIDTHELARILLVQEESYALEVLSQKYGFVHHSAHRALSDVEANLELYYFLLDTISSLPQVFLETVRSFLNDQNHWYAKHLFVNQHGVDTFSPAQKTYPSFEKFVSVSDVLDSLNSLTPDSSFFIRQGWSQKSGDYLLSCAHKLVEKGHKVLLISPKLNFFPSVKSFPTPGVLLDIDRLHQFIDQRSNLSSLEITFSLKCLYRHILGFRGVDDFDLFFKERDLWSLVCVQDESSAQFQAVIAEKSQESILSVSPYAFFKFSHLFSDRILLIDESEVFAEQLLFSAAKSYSLGPYLHHDRDDIAVATQFWITHFCKEVLEPKLKRTLSHYPEKVPFADQDVYNNLAATLLEIAPEEESLQNIASLLKDTTPKQTRWMHYFPETGDLKFGSWYIDDWQTLKNTLHSFRKIFFYRHKPSGSNAFFRIFLASDVGVFFEEETLLFEINCHIPDDLVSVKSPEFNAFTAQKIQALMGEFVSDSDFLVASFSSLETLKKVHHMLVDSLSDSNSYALYGEKVMGGDGKIIQKIKQSSHVVFLDQKIQDPILADMSFKTLVIQKYPFSPPHPIFDWVSERMPAGISLWDVWTVPQVTANLSRRIGHYSHVERVFWLDPRQNSRWGNAILKSLFNSL